MKIGFDIDGVLYPWHYSMYKHHHEFHGFDGTEYDFWKYWRTKSEDWREYYISIPFLYADISPSRDVTTFLPLFAGLGDIYYITSRNLDLRQTTEKYFSKYNFPFKENLVFAVNKIDYIKLLKIDHFIDDLPKYVDELSKTTNAVMFRRPHNRDVADNYTSVGSLREFYNLVKRHSILKELGYGR